MSKLNDLVGRVQDSHLRAEIQDAVREALRQRRFGLVFEEHIPETTVLNGLPIRAGALVQHRAGPDSGTRFRVSGLDGDTVTLIPEGGGPAASSALNDLAVVKAFGEPIFPGLRSVGSLQYGGPNRPYHAVINAENYHALQLFQFMYQGQVDCIYIDPPYNTGARDWKYNNRYVDANDSWRHSKWLSMMQRRLKLARRLLRPDGALICAVDEHEIYHLGMLLDGTFPDFLQYAVTVVTNPRGTARRNFSSINEYAIFVVPDVGKDIILPSRLPVTTPASGQATLAEEESEDDESEAIQSEDSESDDDGDEPGKGGDLHLAGEGIELRHLRRRGTESSYRLQRRNQFYPIYVDDSKNPPRVIRVGDVPDEKQVQLNRPPPDKRMGGLRPVWPVDREGRHRCWRFAPMPMQGRIDRGEVVVGKYNPVTKSWTLNYKVPVKETRRLKSVWWDSRHDAATHGTELVRKLLGEPGLFPFPKSVYLVRDCLDAVVGNRPRALVLDYFAGSGTTFHAVALLNSEDGGSRRSVLVTNNEVSERESAVLAKQDVVRGTPEFESHGIFEQVTRPRCEAVVTGKRRDESPIPGRHLDLAGKQKGRTFAEGFSENVEFLNLDYLDPEQVDLGRQFKAILPILWQAAGGEGARTPPAKSAQYIFPRDSKFAVLLQDARFRRFKEALRHRPDVSHVWLVTNSPEAFAEMRASLPSGLQVSMLYRDYLRTFRINIPGAV